MATANDAAMEPLAVVYSASVYGPTGVIGEESRQEAIARAWKKRLGSHRPALTVLEVAGLLDEEAQVAIEAVALV